MKRNSEALIRYRVINRCIKENGKAGMEFIINSCNKILNKELGAETIEQDLQDMINDKDLAYFAPIQWDPVEKNYFYEDPSYSLDQLPLNDEEKKNLLFAANLLSQFKFENLFGDLQGIIQKLADSILISSHGSNENGYDFINFEKTPPILGSEFLLPLIEAISNHKVLEIYYQPFYEDKPNFVHIHPYLLKEYRFRWYLIGLNDLKKELRTYALDRIIEIKEINTPFVPKKFSASEYFRNTVGIISPVGDPPNIKIEVKKPQANYLLTQPLHSSQYIDYEDDQKIIFNYHVHPTYEFQSMILGMGSDARVIEPSELVVKLKKQLKEALESYS